MNLIPDAELSAPIEVRTLVLDRVDTIQTPKKTAVRQPKGMLALLIAAHNEELVLENTVRSAIRAGMKPADIYVVDDNSTDDTSKIAKSILGEDNILKVRRSGKGLALTKANKRFRLSKRYRWIHIADADGGFAKNYFAVFRSSLRSSYAAATGYVRSLPGSNVGQYRVFEYTVGQEIHRRFQAMANTVSVIPGPTSCFRADVFEKVNFANHSLTEDFDVTLQIHRLHLGRIQFIPRAMAYTQDPRTVGDFVKQISRWNRGIMQGFLRHKIGRRAQRIDAYLTYQVLQNLLFFVSYFIIIPYAAFARQSVDVVAGAFLYDLVVLFALVFLTAIRAGRYDILSSFPYIYMLRWITLMVFLRSFVEVMVLRRFRITHGAWATEGRRYKQTVSL
ncbi:MAG TPA: glycosyltransferase family 2 protein [Candidatus Saccharimonadales bacterium]|nr:glycosyltransferase family 2 protein [Candidatus Saccharimonadales bacterium]